MGLDMYAFTTERSAATTPVDFKPNRNGDGIAELHYWRKHPNLHGWMEDLYRRKGGRSPDFNCDTVELTLTDLDDLEATVRAGKLPHTAGSSSAPATARSTKTTLHSSPRPAPPSLKGWLSITTAGGDALTKVAPGATFPRLFPGIPAIQNPG